MSPLGDSSILLTNDSTTTNKNWIIQYTMAYQRTADPAPDSLAMLTAQLDGSVSGTCTGCIRAFATYGAFGFETVPMRVYLQSPPAQSWTINCVVAFGAAGDTFVPVHASVSPGSEFVVEVFEFQETIS